MIKQEELTNTISILFTIPNFITAGSGRVMFNILTRLDRSKFTPTVCVSRKGGKIDRELEEIGIPVLEMPFTIPVKPYSSFLKRAHEASQNFRSGEFTIWHSFHYSDDYSEPIVAHFSGASAWVYTKKSMSWGSRAWLIRSYLASRIVADNTEMLDKFFKRPTLQKKVRLIPHGLPLDQFKPFPAATVSYRERLQISSGSLLIGCVAQLVPVKDHPTLLQAIARVPDAHLLLAGSTTDLDYQNSLIELCSDLGISQRVHFLGNVQDIPEFLAEIDLFVLPTMGKGRMEGCPVALLEAMACGKACIGTDIPGSHDLIINQESGILVPPSNPEALAKAINYLLASPEERVRFGANARKRVEQNFSIEREVRAHEDLYTELIGRY